ncbi:cupin domain-containing protein [Flavobacterium sp.]|uniref:cupin domain-containing protein n=1 Tax=Flavobacterium sp. TaxID=239 RepID=UPI00121E33E7|nr:cupin domain-containing protein [Flavobacterium sp.]RZJ70517.1 MAG: cupin domain-containing protein [Flavobacterium sp.]
MQNVSLISKTQGEKLPIAGGEYRIIVDGSQTDGAYAMIEMNVPPNGGPNPHKHPGFEETFLVLEGEVEFTSENGKSIARKGDLVRIPKGGPIHCFKNKSGESAKLLCTVVPAGLDEFFRKAAVIAENASAEAFPSEMKHLSEQSGQELFPPDYFG